jgi:phytoene dehydrogenase-like protein
MLKKYDAIIVGGGHNGLVCGAYLAKAGLKTLVLERRHLVGGAAVTEEFFPGYRASTFSYMMGHVNPKIIQDLELAKFGLEHLPLNGLVHPLYDGEYLTITNDRKRNLAEIARFSKKDAEAYPEFFAYLSQSVQILRELILETPIDPSRRDWKTFKEGAKLLWRYRKLGDHLYRIIDTLTLSAYDLVSQWFESDVVKAIFCYWPLMNAFVSPREPGSASSIQFHLLGENGMGFSRGGMGGVSQSIAASGQHNGMEIVTSAPVEEILVKNGRAYGVRLENGDEFSSKLIASNVGASITFGKLVGPDHLPSEFMNDIRNFRASGRAFKINMAVDTPPKYKGVDPKLSEDYQAYAHIAPSMDYIDRCVDDAKDGWYSSQPFISPIVPSMIDNSLAPEGKHVVTLCGGFASYELKGASWDTERDHFVKNVLDTMDEFAPGFSSSIIDMQVLLPPDFERILGMPRGHEHHGEMSLDQLFFMRPVPHYADYRSPVRALYQCGSSTHPAGGVTGVPGHNAAREIMKDWKKLKRNKTRKGGYNDGKN